jgi:hypothetical protein
MATKNIAGTFTTIRWGTSGVLQSNLNTAIVKSVKVSRLGGEVIKMEDNDGFTAIIVGLNDGDKLEIEVVDETAKTWPVFFDVASLKVPGQTNAKNFLILDDDITLTKKDFGTRTIVAEAYANNIV